ncbi:MAG: flavodoxin family protein [Planctomycetota bacterium]
MPNVAIVYHSGYGHTKVVAEAVAQGAGKVSGTDVELIDATTLKPPGQDKQFGPEWAAVDSADAIIMGCPTYMGSVSAGLKQFFEASSAKWMRQEWKDKLAAGFTNSGSMHGDKLNVLQDIMHFAMQHSMVWVGLDLMPGNNSSQSSPDDLNRIGSSTGVMTQANVDQGADEAPPKSDRDTAARLGERVAEWAAKVS